MYRQSELSHDCNKQVLEPGNVKENLFAMSNEKCKTLGDINDILIVQKIKEMDPTDVTSNEISKATQCLCFKTDCDCERNLLAEEQEAIIKKQLQMLQADERGKQALSSEIAALKQRQEQRAELLRNRQRAIDIEKERAKKIASLPPPLPRSVKLLLKKDYDEPKTAKPEVQMPHELTAITMKSVERCYEDKENIVDPKELEAKKKLQEEWQIKAKKRFNEALKKDRRKEEYSNIMKQIQNAELLNRRNMAKNISSEKGMPCPLSDKFQTAKKQTDMEEAAEKLFKKTGTKEHVIEDIEGYQDHYEEKYKKIESNYEAKMIDCIPSFVKENYEYLLEDESKFQGGKNFSGLDDSASDILNQAYIETPPGDEHDGREKIDLAINHLDRLRSNLQTEYEQTLKPLLVAAIEIPKKELSDKAVETEAIKLPAEDKAVETDAQFNVRLTSPSPPPSFDYNNAGVMAYKRRPGPLLSALREITIPDMHRRDVHYTVPSTSELEGLASGSWSSSSYCSLPSKHGIPSFAGAKCDICEMEKVQVENKLPHEHSLNTAIYIKEKSQKSTTSGKAPLSEYVQQLAKKYLMAKSSPLKHVPKDGSVKTFSDSYLPTYSNVETISPAFEKEKIGKSKAGLFVEHKKPKENVETQKKIAMPQEKTFQPSPLIIEKPIKVSVTEGKMTVIDSDETSVKTVQNLKETVLKEPLQEDIHSKISLESPESPVYSDYDLEAKRIQAIHQVLLRRIPRFTLDSSPESSEKKDEKDPEKIYLSARNGMDVKPHVYHELSTIQELDSALTASSLHVSQSKLSDASRASTSKEVPPDEKSKEDLSHSSERLKVASLLDPPGSGISELARNIHFIPEVPEMVHPLESPKAFFSEQLNVISPSSTDDLSVPSHISSIDSNSVTSFSSGAKIFSSTLRENQVKDPHFKDKRTLPQYFKDVSDIKKKVSDSEKSDSYSSIPPTEFLSGTPVSNSSHSVPSIVDVRSKEKIDTQHSIISGYISDLEVPDMSKSDTSHPVLDKKDSAHAVASEHISDVGVPKMTKPDKFHPSKEKKDIVQSIISGYISDLEVPEISESDGPHPNQGNMQSIISGYISDLEVPQMTKTNISHDSHPDQGNMQSIISGNISDLEVPQMTKTNIFHPNSEQKGEPQDFSISPRSFKALTPHSVTPSLKDIHIPSNKHQGYASSSGSFKALTPHSHTPSLRDIHISSDEHQGYASSSGSFKALTPHSHTPSLRDIHIPINEYQDYASSCGSFKALTPHSHTPSLRDIFIPSNENQGYASGCGNFQPLTPHSHTPSLSELDAFTPKNQALVSSSGSFKALTPHTHTPSLSELAGFSPRSKHQDYASNFGNFKALAPKSVISSPSHSSDEAESKRKASSGSSEIHSMVVKLDISTSSFSSDSTNSKALELNKIPQISCNLALKTHLSNLTNYIQPVEKPAQKTITGISDQRIYHVNDSKNVIQMKQNGLYNTETKRAALACASDFFVPSISENLTTTEENNGCDIIKDILIPEREDNSCNPKLAFDSQMAVLNVENKNQGDLVKQKQSGSEYISSAEGISAKLRKEKRLFEESKESNIKQKFPGMAKGFSKYGNLRAISSTSSSTESLSEISGSKIIYQSTPIKNLSEIIQEPGILEEPDLTLVTTELSCNVGSPEIPRDPSTSVPLKYSTNDEKDCILTPTQNECITPCSQSPHLMGSPDTPSMLSFLHHEASCMQAEKDEVHVPAREVNISPSTSENNTPFKKEVEGSLFPRTDYKQRTRRLWNNLEEVRKKNLTQERKKLMELNRQKAKEYSKKLTPKHKGK